VSYLEEGAHFCVSGRSRDDFNTSLMEWIPGKENEMARYKDRARMGHDITFITRERLFRAVGKYLKNTHYFNATKPERIGASDTHLLILIAQTRRGKPTSHGRTRHLVPTEGAPAVDASGASGGQTKGRNAIAAAFPF
jgi:hypothetical protein